MSPSASCLSVETAGEVIEFGGDLGRDPWDFYPILLRHTLNYQPSGLTNLPAQLLQ